MTAFENYGSEASLLELEIERKGIALGIDWNDAATVDALAREALGFKPGPHAIDPGDLKQRARLELFGLANLMLKVMAESAQEQIHTHGGTVWKTFGGALWRVWKGQSGTT